MSNFYYDPGDFGLTPVGEIDWSDGCYQFDLTVVWQRMDGRLVYAEDCGCSCPAPFEAQGVPDLTLCSPAQLQAHLTERCADRYGDDRTAEAADLMHKIMTTISIPGSVARDLALTPGSPDSLSTTETEESGR
jgi:hypothetical protein